MKKLISLGLLLMTSIIYSQSQSGVKDNVLYITTQTHDTILAIAENKEQFISKMDSLGVLGNRNKVCASIFKDGKMVVHKTYERKKKIIKTIKLK